MSFVEFFVDFCWGLLVSVYFKGLKWIMLNFQSSYGHVHKLMLADARIDFRWFEVLKLGNIRFRKCRWVFGTARIFSVLK